LSRLKIQTYFNDITFYVNFGNQESDRYRVFNIAEALLKKGIKCNFLSLISSEEEIEKVLNKTDIIIFFRSEFNLKISKILSVCKEKKIPTVFDIDDLLFDPELFKNLQENTTAKRFIDNQEEILSYTAKLKQTFENCDFFTGSTQTLVEIAQKYNKKSFLIKNTINYNQHKLAKELILKKDFSDKKIKIGYFSGSNTHNEDFIQCKKALFQILERYKDIELHIVGYLDMDFDKYSHRITRVPFMNYLEMLEYLSKIDINTAPLELNTFNDAKSELKIFEAGLVMTPTIASLTASYKNCIKDGINGFLALTKEDWAEKISLLIEDRKLRENIARKAREDFTKEFYINNCIYEIINIYNSIILEHKNNVESKKLYNPKDSYRELCNNLNLEYTLIDLENLDLLSVLYRAEDDLTGFKNNIAVNFKEKFKNKKICFWGAGKFLERLLPKIDLTGLNIVGIIDKDPKKRLSKIKDISIFNPEDIEKLQPDIIILTVEKPSTLEPVIKKVRKNKNLNIEVYDIINLLFAQNYQ